MSTKTTFKRVALVAVAALGLGVLTSVAPASAAAAAETPNSVSLGAAVAARVGQATTVGVNLNFAAALEDDDTVTVSAKVLTAPSGSRHIASDASSAAAHIGNTIAGSSPAQTGNLVFTGNGVGTDAATNTNRSAATAGQQYTAVSAVLTNNANTTQAWSGAFLKFIPDVAGTYTILVSGDDADTTYTAGNASVVWTVTTSGAPTTVTLSSVNSTVTADGAYGSRIKVVLTNAEGAAVLGANESLSLTSSDADVTFTSDGTSAITALSASNFTTYGYAIFYAETVSVDTLQTAVVTVSGSGLLSSAVSGSITTTHRAPTTAPATASILLGDATTAGSATTTTAPDGYEFVADDSFRASPTVTSHGIFYTVAGASTAQYFRAYITDDDGVISGIAGTVIDTLITVPATATGGTAATEGTLSVTAALGLLTSTSVQVTMHGSSAVDTITITGGTPAQTTTTIDTASLRSLDGGANTMTATTYDQFGVEIANAVVSVSVSGRNTVAAVSKISDADGRVSITWTDAGTATTSNKQDTVLFDAAAGTDDSEIVTYGAYTVGTVTVTGGATANTVAYPAVGSTTKAISTAVAGAAGSATTFTATVKDASGNVLSGVPVTWTVDKATAGITKTLTADSATCVTGSAGTCTTTVFSWAAPSKVTVTATSGDKTGTGYENFVNAASDARVLSATVSGALVLAKVVDRYGNPVAAVTVSAKTSNGYFGSGATSTTGVTTEDGTVGFALTGAGTVTVSVDSATYTQTDDAAGKVGTTAVTAAVAGTTTGTGASLSPAGVNSVAVEITEGTNSAVNTAAQAAADAAAEATDAANAATDAANAAAEAADAATAAAQDAADAVAALSTQVSEMVDALKKQITALTNLVIKIQKKVKA
jgi:trimeric autotransporter adhesin